MRKSKLKRITYYYIQFNKTVIVYAFTRYGLDKVGEIIQPKKQSTRTAVYQFLSDTKNHKLNATKSGFLSPDIGLVRLGRYV